MLASRAPARSASLNKCQGLTKSGYIRSHSFTISSRVPQGQWQRSSALQIRLLYLCGGWYHYRCCCRRAALFGSAAVLFIIYGIGIALDGKIIKIHLPRIHLIIRNDEFYQLYCIDPVCPAQGPVAVRGGEEALTPVYYADSFSEIRSEIKSKARFPATKKLVNCVFTSFFIVSAEREG